MKNLHISCNTVNCKIVRHFGNERVAMAASSVLVSLTFSRVLKLGGQVGHLGPGRTSRQNCFCWDKFLVKFLFPVEFKMAFMGRT